MGATFTLQAGYSFVANDDVTIAKLNNMFLLGRGVLDAGTLTTSDLEDEAVTLAKMADLARGSIITGQTASNRPTALAAETDAQILIGDGTDLNSVAMSGDISIDNTGATTIVNPSFPPSWKFNLQVKNNAATPNTQIDVDCDELVVESAANIRTLLEDIDVTINTGVVGANGIDAGAQASSTMYYVWIIYDSSNDTTAGLISTSSTNPTMPGGYDQKRLVSEVYSDGSTHFTKHDRRQDVVWLEDPQAIYTAQTLTTSFVQHNLPSAIPSGCTKLYFEAGCSTATSCFQILSPDSTTRFEETIQTNQTGVNTNQGPTTSFASKQVELKHLGATSIYARANDNASVNNQNLHIWGYELAR